MKQHCICFLAQSALVVTLCLGVSIAKAQDAGWGNLTGKIVVDGEVPANAPEDVGDSPDRAACLVDGKLPLDDGIMVGKANELRDVYVMMYLARNDKGPEEYHPSYEEKKKIKLTLDNVRCRFVPKSTFARPGQTLILKNSDDVGHNCHITTFEHEYNPTIPPNKEIEIKLDESSDRIPGDVKCDIHKWMDAVILIRDNPYVAISDADGKFKIENIPPGNWKFQFWHKKIGYLKTIEVTGHKVDGKRGFIETKIEDGKTLDLGTLTLPAAAFSK